MALDLDTMADGDLDTLSERIAQERERRQASTAAREHARRALTDLAAALGVSQAEAWRSIAPEGVTVTPPATPTAPAFKQPTGAHDAYAKGALVTYDGTVYRSLIAANAYSPAAYPQGWEKA